MPKIKHDNIYDRAAHETTKVLQYFHNLEILGKFVGENVDQQKRVFLIKVLVNFANLELMR